MTNQELCDKIDALYDAGEFEEIISIVENLPEKEQTYHILFVLAAAYSDLSDLGNDDFNTYHYKAIKILKKIADQGENDLNWLYLIGRTYFNANFEEYAIEYFEKINRICKKDPDLDTYMNLSHFVEKCQKYLYERTLTVVVVTLENAAKDKDLTVESIQGNQINLFFPKYNIKLNIAISDLRRSGACLEYTISYPDNAVEHYQFEGYGHTFENGITDALNRFITEVNNNLAKHYKK